ncbi:MAG: tetratricopeptide repeat protein [Pseudomonadota bacterium]
MSWIRPALRPLIALFLVGIAALWSAPPAQANDFLRRCLDERAGAETLALACRSALNAGGLDRRETAAAWTNSGIALAELGRDGDALAAYDRAVAADPTFTPAYANRALSRARRGRVEEAIADWSEVIARAPRDGDALLGRAGLHLVAGRPAQALADADAGLRLAPRSSDLHYTRGLALGALNRTAEAVSAFDAALRLDPGDAEAWMQRGLIQARAAPAAALRDLTRAIDIVPKRAVLYVHRGQVLEGLGRQGEADRDYRRAFELGFQSPWLNQRIEAMGG